jgi:hypothetical protein
MSRLDHEKASSGLFASCIHPLKLPPQYIPLVVVESSRERASLVRTVVAELRIIAATGRSFIEEPVEAIRIRPEDLQDGMVIEKLPAPKP